MLRRSESRIIVLNCEASAAAQVLKQANQYGLAGFGYAWIVTDGVAGKFVSINLNAWNFSYLTNFVYLAVLKQRFQKLWKFAEFVFLFILKQSSDKIKMSEKYHAIFHVIHHPKIVN